MPTLVKSLFCSPPTPLDELQTGAKNAWDRYTRDLSGDKVAGSRRGQEEHLDHDAGQTPVREEKGEKRLACESQATAQFSGRIGQASEKSISKHYLLEESQSGREGLTLVDLPCSDVGWEEPRGSTALAHSDMKSPTAAIRQAPTVRFSWRKVWVARLHEGHNSVIAFMQVKRIYTISAERFVRPSFKKHCQEVGTAQDS